MAASASSAVYHSILSNHVTHVQTQTRRNASFRVCCMAEDKQSPISTPRPRVAPKMSTKFTDLLAFSGPAPERINGRLAMIGFVTAIGVELAKGTDVAAQLGDGGLPWFLYTCVLLSVASIVPLAQGVSVESKSDGIMSSTAEMWNGRAAMLGLVALVLTEVAKGGALI
ncbi:hypothetical protein C5167_018453 [Papaver somniferum]|uniref:Uncharacterized protein n=1 Tax=Papaver somniferum TaxID=3469 RepID=A0A4Y7IRB6_PAPSO|nr:early light-induced protein, chloroplastic-like [Papaver somniferum]RZC50029.1 hypothetical protein C5167_018453 [Papaver somniferum]